MSFPPHSKTNDRIFFQSIGRASSNTFHVFSHPTKTPNGAVDLDQSLNVPSSRLPVQVLRGSSPWAGDIAAFDQVYGVIR